VRWTGREAHVKEKEVYTGVGVKPEGERSLGICTCRWKGNIKVYVQGIECEGVEWNNLAQDGDH